MTHEIFTSEMVAGLVREVVRRIHAEAVAAPVAGVAAVMPPPPPTLCVIPSKVITLDTFKLVPQGTRRVGVRSDAVITPSARDHAREAGIELVRGDVQPPVHSTIVIGQADCLANAASRAASIARAVAGAQQLPASGLADVVAAIALHVGRDGAKGVLLTGRPAAAVVLANRFSSLRAVTARDAATLLAAAAQCAANVLIIHPQEFASGALERACVEFASRDTGVIPNELSGSTESHQPCNCNANSPHSS
ncbi:MAG: hypothetical protein NTY25_09295 [Planctomycetia bacterium]|nr:hypothetical protein [Planctomycetia bacterium]